MRLGGTEEGEDISALREHLLQWGRNCLRVEGAPGQTQESQVNLLGGDGVRDAIKVDNIICNKHTVTANIT